MSSTISEATIQTAGKIIDSWLPVKIKYDELPGVTVGIVHRGKLVYSNAFGLADVEHDTPMSIDTTFRVASISKMFTAVAVLQLVEQKKIRLIDTIGKHLPWTKGAVAKLTIKHVLSHTGGMLRDGDTTQWSDDNFPTSEELQASVLRTEAVRKYRNRFKYSNFGYALLGEVIKQSSGLNFEEYVAKNIIRKIGMDGSAPDLTDESKSGLATGYSRFIPDTARTPFNQIPARSYSPAAGVISNILDLAKFVSALLKGNSLLSPQSRKLMFKEMAKSGKDNNGYGLGSTIAKVKGYTITGHRGAFPGFITRISIDAKNDLAVIVLTNSIDGLAREICTGILEMIYDLPTLTKGHGKKNITGVGEVEGTYRNRWSDTTVVSAGKCLVAFTPKENSPLNDASVLVEKKSSTFEIVSKNGYGTLGENATFADGKMMWGPSESNKL